MADRFSTGVRELDRELDGGLAPGTLLVLRTPPESQGELLLKELALAHETLYLTTTRTDQAVRAWLSTDTDLSGVDVRYVREPVSETRSDDTDRLRELLSAESGWAEESPPRPDGGAQNATVDTLDQAVKSFRGPGCVVVDPVNPVERMEESSYVDFLHRFQNHLVNTESVGVLHAVISDTPPDDRWVSLQLADEVWDIQVETDDSVRFRLVVTKSRSGTLPDEEIKLELDDRVAIDVSRDIA